MPEIADGLVEIRGVAREPGYRSKIAVESHAQGVDPVGACVGPRGSRVRMVVSELRGEKIDIIPWNNEPARFVAKALSPARVREVYLDDDGKEATVVVPDDQLALAIGKEGMNARLAARLTGWKIDIQSDTEFAQAEAEIAFGGGDGEGEELSGRCSAILANGKRCPNAALPGSKYCGVAGAPGARAARPGRRGAGRAPSPSPSSRRSPTSCRPTQSRSARRCPSSRSPRSTRRRPPTSLRRTAPTRRRSRPTTARSISTRLSAEAAPPAEVPAGIPVEHEEALGRGVGAASRSGRCVGCGRRAPQSELVRFAARDGELVPGRDGAGPRRVHLQDGSRASSGRQAQRGFARVLRQAVRVDPALARLYTEESNG